jgi:hypothetical protein
MTPPSSLISRLLRRSAPRNDVILTGHCEPSEAISVAASPVPNVRFLPLAAELCTGRSQSSKMRCKAANGQRPVCADSTLPALTPEPGGSTRAREMEQQGLLAQQFGTRERALPPPHFTSRRELEGDARRLKQSFYLVLAPDRRVSLRSFLGIMLDRCANIAPLITQFTRDGRPWHNSSAVLPLAQSYSPFGS